MRVPRPDHEKWIREHFPEELKKEDFDYLFWGLYYLEDGLSKTKDWYGTTYTSKI